MKNSYRFIENNKIMTEFQEDWIFEGDKNNELFEIIQIVKLPFSFIVYSTNNNFSAFLDDNNLKAIEVENKHTHQIVHFFIATKEATYRSILSDKNEMNYIVFGYWYPKEDMLLVGLNNYHKDDIPINEDSVQRFDLNRLRNLISKDNTKNLYNVGMQNNSLYKKNNTYQSFLGFDINKHLTFTNLKLFNIKYCLGTIDNNYKLGITAKSKIWLFCNSMLFCEQQKIIDVLTKNLNNQSKDHLFSDQKKIKNIQEIKYCILNPKIYNMKKENNHILDFIEKTSFDFKNGVITFEEKYKRRNTELDINLQLIIYNGKLLFDENNLSNSKKFTENFIFYNENFEIIDSNCNYFVNDKSSNNHVKPIPIINKEFNEINQLIINLKNTQPDKIKHTISIYYPRFQLIEELSKNYISNFKTILQENNIEFNFYN